MWQIAAALVVVVITLWLIWRKKKFSYFKELGIPGPEPNIFFGNLLELIREGTLECHNKWTEQYGPVSGHYFGRKPILLVTDTDLLKKIEISDFHKFPNRANVFETADNRGSPVEQEGFESSLISLRDKRWKEVRSILTPSFTTSKMRLMSPIISRAVDVLIENIDKKAKNKESFDIYKMYQGLTMDVIGRTAFGIQTDVQRNPNDPFLRTVKIILRVSVASFLTILGVSFPEIISLWTFLRRIQLRFQNKGKDPTEELKSEIAHVISMRRKDKSARRNDLLQLMIDAEISEADLKKISDQDLAAGNERTESEQQQNGPGTKQSSKLLLRMTDNEIIENAVLFFVAGYETTSTTLAFITHFLIHHPEVQERLRKEVKDLVRQEGSLEYSALPKLQYMEQVAWEALRIYPPIHLFVTRDVGEDLNYGNMKIKKGTAIQVPIHILQHSPELWTEPEKFDPERFSPENKSSHNPMAWQPFGAGPRNCVGMRFALMEIKLALAEILLKYRLVRTDETDKDPITLRVQQANMVPAKGIILKAVLL